MFAQNLFYIIIGILLLEYCLDFVLEYLNSRRFGAALPSEVQGIYDAEEYQKSQQYKRVNYRFSRITSTLSIVLTLGFLILGGFQWVDELSGQISANPMVHALVFFGILFLGSDLISLPLSYYHTFVIEERFGFNKSTRGLFFMDKIKGWVLALILGGGLLTGIMWFYDLTGPSFWIYAWGMIAVFTLLINLFYSRLIVPIFNRQTPLEEGSLRERIQQYASKVEFGLKQIFIIDGSRRSTKANAYFSGFGKQRRVTLYDTLIEDLNEEEVVAVLAHEVGHYKRNHILVNLLMSILLTGLTLFLLSLFINNPELSGAIGVSQPSFHAALLGFALLYSPISELTSLIMNYISRRFEYQADAFARDTYAAEPLISSLKKLSRNHQSNLTPHPAYVIAHYSHPTLVQRIRHLMSAS